MALINLFNVTKRYGSRSAISDLSLEVNKGEFVFIAGSSGAGKTTLIKLLMAEIIADLGQIVIDRFNLKRMPASKIPGLRRRLGVVFQDFKLIPTRTVFQNVALRLEIEGISQENIGKKVRYVLKKVGLEGKDQAFPLQLSGGEQQRVAIARAIVGDPLIVLADEPTGNLDMKLSTSIVTIFEEINRTGTTVMMATHNRDILEGTRHRIIKLEDGRLMV
ncbi:MAG: cell division ATP-binding protein FtsE [Deltaproteobacteria bacterium]|nr:cell division ATP-binding protein FtsE [Deltaproteobacteria bacterium]